jgi:hypothetical protein
MTDRITTPEALVVSTHFPPGLPGFEPAAGAGLLGELAAQLPGYLLPRLVREIEGAPAKVSLTPRLSVPRAGSHRSSAGGC